jgi:hypothetical protein
LHTHFPAEQVVPVPQGVQATPPVPQVGVLDVWHLPLESQQPLGHDDALQTHLPEEQVWPLAQGPQVAPPVPQVPMFCDAPVMTQVLPLQQPPLQELVLQTQAPALQVWPVAQVTQAAPLVPQVFIPEVWHWPL